MQPLTACIIGMMVGTVVLLGTVVFTPHPLGEFCADYKKFCICKK